MHTVLIIGAGRMAQHLTYWNSLLKYPNTLIYWNRKENSVNELNQKLKQASIAWLAISDSSISSFFDQYLSSCQISIVHFSGALQDSRIISAHPLMSFPTELMSGSVYSQIHFVLTGINNLQKVLPGFLNSFSLLDEKNKGLYHALCVVSGNFPQLLWSEALPEFEKLGIPTKAVEVYIQQITANFIELKSRALTGPLIRKDTTTIAKNLKSLEKSKLKKIYNSFTEVFGL